ncbi:MAG TPA: hypothetical protein VFY66_13215 [Anaerolineales bacterium]|nr:hypothetical protein [Anaerolineales bacterium]
MPNIDAILREINKDLVPQFEEKLRTHLAEQDKEWLIEQIIRLTLDAHSLEEMDRKHIREEDTKRRQERAERARKLDWNEKTLEEFVQQYDGYSREKLIQEGFLSPETPARGGKLITEDFRSLQGNELLEHAKDMLFGFLFGDESTNTHFHRTQRELLTLTVPRMKSDVLDFMKATTELSAQGTWQDPKGAVNDMRADNVVLEIEYGELEGERIGNAIVTALRLINNLEINEEILYGRIERIEQSTLVS